MDRNELFDNIRNDEILFPFKNKIDLSDSCIDLLSRLLRLC